MKAVAMTLVVLLTLSAWSAHTHADGAGRKRIDNAYFSFEVPLDMAKTSDMGIDSYIEVYESAKIRLGFDYGVNADPLDYDRRLPEYQESDLRVDNRRARIVSFRQGDGWYTAIHFPDAGPVTGERSKLTIHASCKAAGELRLARDIFTSVRFK